MAQYRYDILASKTVAWTSRDGRALTVTVALVQETSDYFGNGEYQPTRDGLNVRISSAIDGKDQNDGWIKPSGQTPVVATIGKIGLLPERLAEIEAAQKEIEAHPAYAALMTARAKGEQMISDEYEAHRKAVDNMMTLNGRTF